jgi:hypothetical protein
LYTPVLPNETVPFPLLLRHDHNGMLPKKLAVMKHLLSLFFALTSLVIAAHAQTIQLQGLVRDQQTGEEIPGATITIKGAQNARVVSGLNGFYVARQLAPGSYTITINCVGYKPYETTFTVTPEVKQIFSVTLEPNKNELTEVIISGKHDKGSDVSTLQASRRADHILNAVSARSIEISPDLSVANVTQRISGVSLERSKPLCAARHLSCRSARSPGSKQVTGAKYGRGCHWGRHQYDHENGA